LHTFLPAASFRLIARRFRFRVALTGLLVGPMLFVSLGAIYWLFSRPTGLQTPRQVQILPGMSARSIGRLLEEEGLIRSALVFTLTVQLQGMANRLEAGTYLLSGTKTTAGIIQDLFATPAFRKRVTIPEGLTRQEIAGLLARNQLVDSTRFIALTADSAFVRRLGIEAPTLEGYLFPETYFFDPHTPEEQVIERLVGEFKQVVADSLRQRVRDLGLTLHETVTLASIVEREAKVKTERPIISGIFHQRLRLNLRLESCATVVYALGLHKEHLTSADTQVDSPFNTYRYQGLPPGPIGNPGRASLLATLYPAETSFLYFVARGDGTHRFSRTNEEHELAKRLLRRTELGQAN
jgi:UPF0755 protein